MPRKGCIWLIGGTQESVELATAIAQAQLPCIITVTTETAIKLYPDAPELQVKVRRLQFEQLSQFLQEHQIAGILDASHPFAVEISQLAISTATQEQIPYLRYERPVLTTNGLHLDSFATLLAGDYLKHQRVLLTVGYRPLPLFQSWQEQATLLARILPSSIALNTALAAGFTLDRLIALRPPISAALERALWQQWQVSLVVTKASGRAGGEDIKQQVAVELGVNLVTIDRPTITYPQQTSSFSKALAFCVDLVNS